MKNAIGSLKNRSDRFFGEQKIIIFLMPKSILHREAPVWARGWPTRLGQGIGPCNMGDDGNEDGVALSLDEEASLAQAEEDLQTRFASEIGCGKCVHGGLAGQDSSMNVASVRPRRSAATDGR